MGQAKRRKDLGCMPEPSQKPRKKARSRTKAKDALMDMGGVIGLMSSLMMRGQLNGTIKSRRG
jgi:hypothetical protein